MYAHTFHVTSYFEILLFRNFQSSVIAESSADSDSSSQSKDTGPAPNSYQTTLPITLSKKEMHSYLHIQYNLSLYKGHNSTSDFYIEVSFIEVPCIHALLPLLHYVGLPGGAAPFKSKTKRGWASMMGQHTPGPGQYNPCSPTGAHTYISKTANFQSKTKRTQLINNIGNPGPADYFRGIRSSSSIPYHKQKHYLCISAPAIPLPPLPPTPGPGHYELIQNTSEEQLVGGAVFKSTSSRWKGDQQSMINPGPGTLNYFMQSSN